MTGPDRPPTGTQPTDEQATLPQPEVAADANTARPRSPWRGSGIPSHLWRARTSTVVLSVLFLAIGTLYLQIRPDPERPSRTETGTEQPAPEPAPVPETTAPEDTTEAPESSAPTPTTTRSTSAPTRTTGTPDGTTTAPEETSEETSDEDTPRTSAPSPPSETGTGSAPG